MYTSTMSGRVSHQCRDMKGTNRDALLSNHVYPSRLTVRHQPSFFAVCRHSSGAACLHDVRRFHPSRMARHREQRLLLSPRRGSAVGGGGSTPPYRQTQRRQTIASPRGVSAKSAVEGGRGITD